MNKPIKLTTHRPLSYSASLVCLLMAIACESPREINTQNGTPESVSQTNTRGTLKLTQAMSQVTEGEADEETVGEELNPCEELALASYHECMTDDNLTAVRSTEEDTAEVVPVEAIEDLCDELAYGVFEECIEAEV